MYNPLFKQMKKGLGQLVLWLDKAEEYAKTKGFDSNLFANFRLAPDQFGFARQVFVTCDTAKLAASRLTGKDAPKNEDTEQTLAELKARVLSTLAYLEGFGDSDFDAAATATITQPRWQGSTMTGADYFVEHVIPNFFFHLTTAYAILRHNGVPVGKRDFLGALTMTAPAAS